VSNPSLRLVVMPRSPRTGAIRSQRAQRTVALHLYPTDAEGRVMGHLKLDLREAGFQPGDLVEVSLVRRERDSVALAGGRS
jgi:hypothetical protein